ncbi:MAG: ABC transporter permease [Lachnospiraceae bacterium]|nr:ABC transporter permease [Lachnospiraceae bacterium]
MNKSTLRFIISKFLELVLTLIVVTMISFVLVRFSPIDPAEAYAHRSMAAYSYTDQQMDELRTQMGLNDTLPVQYINWVKDALQLDFGKSFVSGQPVLEKIMSAISITISIVLISAVIQIVFILLVGCLCYICRKRIVGHLLTFLCIAGISIPSFFFASTYIDIFAVKLRLTSVVGNIGIMRYLPAAICIAIGCVAFFAPLLSTNIEKEMRLDSAFYARCRGLSEMQILLRYALPTACISILPNFFQMLGLCMAGSAIVERVFSLPGLGYLIIDSVLYRDSPVIHATILFLAFALVLFNILSDILRRALQRDQSADEGARL